MDKMALLEEGDSSSIGGASLADASGFQFVLGKEVQSPAQLL
jgi:hypothetical protein